MRATCVGGARRCALFFCTGMGGSGCKKLCVGGRTSTKNLQEGGILASESCVDKSKINHGQGCPRLTVGYRRPWMTTDR